MARRRVSRKTMRRRSTGRKKVKRTGRKKVSPMSWKVSSSKWSTVSRRKSRHKSGRRPPSDWNKHLMAVYRSMKAKDSKVTFGQAMKQAKHSYKKAGSNLGLNKMSGGGPGCPYK